MRRVSLPKVGAPHVPAVHVPRPGGLGLPGKEKLVWFGGLAGLAALGVVTWPVAGVVAAGTYAAERFARQAAHEEQTDPSRDTET